MFNKLTLKLKIHARLCSAKLFSVFTVFIRLIFRLFGLVRLNSSLKCFDFLHNNHCEFLLGQNADLKQKPLESKVSHVKINNQNKKLQIS